MMLDEKCLIVSPGWFIIYKDTKAITLTNSYRRRQSINQSKLEANTRSNRMKRCARSKTKLNRSNLQSRSLVPRPARAMRANRATSQRLETERNSARRPEQSSRLAWRVTSHSIFAEDDWERGWQSRWFCFYFWLVQKVVRDLFNQSSSHAEPKETQIRPRWDLVPLGPENGYSDTPVPWTKNVHKQLGKGINHREIGDKFEVDASTACENVNTADTDETCSD